MSRCRKFESVIDGTVDCCDFSDETDSEEHDTDDENTTDGDDENDEDEEDDEDATEEENVDDEEYEAVRSRSVTLSISEKRRIVVDAPVVLYSWLFRGGSIRSISLHLTLQSPQQNTPLGIGYFDS